MSPSHDQQNDFFGHRPIPGVAFEHDDAVEVTGGEHAGDSGAIISVEELGDDPAYLVELSSGQDAIIRQSLLRLAAA